MATDQAIDRDTLTLMAALLIRDCERTQRYADQVSNMPKMHAKYLGIIEGERNALAMIAGYLDYGTTDELIGAVRRLHPRITEPGATTTVHDAEASREAAAAGSVARVLAADARAAWPVDFEEGEA